MNVSRPPRRATLGIACAALWLLALPAAGGAQDEDSEFLEGLRQRQLFDLAELYCRQELEQAEPRRAAELTIELIRTLARHAAHVDPAERGPMWEEVRRVGAALQGNPREFLLRTQMALAELARAELARQEMELQAGEDARQRALDAIRQAERLLEALDKELTAEIPRRRRRPPSDPDALTADELFSLQSHVQLHLASALRTRARCYQAGSADRAAALQAALQWSAKPLDQLAPDELLAHQLRLEQAAARRLLGQRTAASEILSNLASSSHGAIRRAAMVEAARLELDAGEHRRALAALQRVPFGSDPESDWVRMQASLGLLAAAKRQDDQPAEQQARDAAVELAKQIRVRHGAYWGRRADQLLVSVAGGGRGGSGDMEILTRQADQLFLAGELGKAAQVYDLASDKALEQNDHDTAFQLGYKSALVAGRQGNLLGQSVRLRELAVDVPTHPQAPAAHRQAVLLTAQLARQDSSLLDTYQQLLQEHVRLWPDGAHAGEVRLWLGQLLQQRGQWQASIDALQEIAAGDAHELPAIEPLAACHTKLLETLPEGQVVAAAQRAAQSLEARVVEGGALPSRWTPARRAAALAAARLWLQFVPASHRRAESLVRSAMTGQPPAPAEWTQRARPLLVASLAGQADKIAEAEQVLQQLAAASPEQLLETLRGLTEAAQAAPPQSRAALAALQLETIDGLFARPALDAALRAQLQRTRAEALAVAGRWAEAMEAYEQLVRRHPRDGALQAQYARLLSRQDGQADRALNQWRRVAAGARPKTGLWYEAKYEVAKLLLEQGDKEQARQRLLWVQAVHGLDDTPWKPRYLALLRQCE